MMKSNTSPRPDEGIEKFMNSFCNFVNKELLINIGPRAKLSYLYTLLYTEGNVQEKLIGLLKSIHRKNISNHLSMILSNAEIVKLADQYQLLKAVEVFIADQIKIVITKANGLFIASQEQNFLAENEKEESLYHIQFHKILLKKQLQKLHKELHAMYHLLKEILLLHHHNISTTWIGLDPLRVQVLAYNQVDRFEIKHNFRLMQHDINDYQVNFVGKTWLLEKLNDVFAIILQQSIHDPKTQLRIVDFPDICQVLNCMNFITDHSQKFQMQLCDIAHQLQQTLHSTKVQSLPFITIIK